MQHNVVTQAASGHIKIIHSSENNCSQIRRNNNTKDDTGFIIDERPTEHGTVALPLSVEGHSLMFFV